MNYRFLAIALGAVYLTACGGREVSLPSTPSIVVPADNLVTGEQKEQEILAKTHKFGESFVVKRDSLTTKLVTVTGKQLKDINLSGPLGKSPKDNAITNNVQDLNTVIIYTPDYKGDVNHVYKFSDEHDFNQNTYVSYNVVNAGNMSYARYGMIEDDYAEHSLAFYQGYQTPIKQIPTTGIAVYQGHSLYGCIKCGDKWQQGDASLTANFDTKSLSGSIKGVGVDGRVGAILATISGNTFKGDFDGTTTTGAFFGPQAEELSGVFVNEKRGTIGSFGASK